MNAATIALRILSILILVSGIVAAVAGIVTQTPAHYLFGAAFTILGALGALDAFRRN